MANEQSNPQTTKGDWQVRIGLIALSPLAFVYFGMKGVMDLFKEFWNAAPTY